MSPRFRKIAGDVRLMPARVIVMTVAIATGAFAVAAISTAYDILRREINRSYLTANPPSALLDVDGLDEETVHGVRALAGVAWADSTHGFWSRAKVGPREWLPLLVFEKHDFAQQRFGKLRLLEGRWPGSGEIALEGTDREVLDSALGRPVTVQTRHGSSLPLNVTGYVYDATLPPAAQQQAAYGYLTTDTAAGLGETDPPHSLALYLENPAADSGEVERLVAKAARWLQQSGHTVGEVRIPPRSHPHWGVMKNIIRMLLYFGIATLGLGAVLTAAVTATWLAPQIRQIGVMKAIGARTGDIILLYAVLIALCGTVAGVLGIPLGICAGRSLAMFVAQNQNSELASLSISAGLICLQVAGALLLPLLIALIPIWSAARHTVHQCLSDYGAAPPAAGLPRYRASALTNFPWLTLALRNTFRRKRRLLFTVALLGFAGALFVTSLNVLEAWRGTLHDAAIERHFDIEVQFAESEEAAAVIAALKPVGGVSHAEAFTEEAAAVVRDDGLRITQTYADGGHGSVKFDTVPRGSAFLNPQLLKGRWLSSAGADAAVLNESALTHFPGATVGDRIRLDVGGRRVDLKIAGVLREHLAAATVYVAALDGTTGGLRIALRDRNDSTAPAAIERSLNQRGFRVVESVTQARVGRALAGHLFILIALLFAMSFLMALVGMMGLASMLLANVLERSREFGVMRALGASDGTVMLTVICEAVAMAFLGAVASAVISIPTTIGVAWVIGDASLGPALNTALSATAVPLWTALLVIGSSLVAVSPALQVLRTRAHESVAFAMRALLKLLVLTVIVATLSVLAHHVDFFGIIRKLHGG